METVARIVLNVFFSAWVSFYLSFAFISLFSLLVKNYRARYYLFLLPLLKLTYDLVFMNHSNWAFRKGLPVIGAEDGSRSIEAYVGTHGTPFAGVRLHFCEGQETFSLGDVITEWIGVPFAASIAVGLLLLTATSILRWSFQLYKSYQWKHSLPLKHISENLYTTVARVHTPLLLGSRIVIPQDLMPHLNKEEYAAILTHEKEHLKWKDGAISLLTSFTLALFWFLPFRKKIMGRAALFRELACDMQAAQAPLLSALGKTMKGSIPRDILAFSSFKRVTYLLKGKKGGNISRWVSLIVITGGGIFILASDFLPF